MVQVGKIFTCRRQKNFILVINIMVDDALAMNGAMVLNTSCNIVFSTQGLHILILNMLNYFEDYKRYIDILGQEDAINSGTTVQGVWPTQPIPWQLMHCRL